MALSFLEACRENDNDNNDDTFSDKINRGGLWRLSRTANELFLIIETIFRKMTSGDN